MIAPPDPSGIAAGVSWAFGAASTCRLLFGSPAARRMKIGESKKVTVPAKDGYGEVEATAFMNVPREAFPTNVPLEKGIELELRDQTGHPMYARIETISEQNIRLNMNHPLAGKDLDFDVMIANLRPATDEEVSHGHVHTPTSGHEQSLSHPSE